MKRVLLAGLLVASLFPPGGATAQTSDRLPSRLSGKWTAAGATRVYVDTLSLSLDGTGEPGPISGKLTFRGFNCGAQDEPFTGTWDGADLRFEAIHRPNVNAQRMNGDCGSGKTIYVLRRKSGGQTLEGEARPADGSIGSVISVALMP